MSSSSSNSGSRTAVPYALARTTVRAPLFMSPSVECIQSTNGFSPTRLMAVRLTTRMCVGILQRAAVFGQPAPRRLVVGTGGGDEFPECSGVIEPAQVHQLVDHHVVADGRRHADKAPIQ